MVTGVPEGVRIIVAGQDLVRDGETVEVVAARGHQGRMKIVETAIANARLTISVLMFLMLAGAMAYVIDPEGGRAGHPDPDHLRQHDTITASRPRTASGCCCGRWKPR